MGKTQHNSFDNPTTNANKLQLWISNTHNYCDHLIALITTKTLVL